MLVRVKGSVSTTSTRIPITAPCSSVETLESREG